MSDLPINVTLARARPFRISHEPVSRKKCSMGTEGRSSDRTAFLRSFPGFFSAAKQDELRSDYQGQLYPGRVPRSCTASDS